MAEKRKTWLWILGWVFCFPVPLTILMLRNKKLSPTVKYAIIGVGWVLYVVLFVMGGCNNKRDKTTVEEPAAQEQYDAKQEDTEEKQSQEEKVEEAVPSAAVQMIADDTLKSFVQAYEEITGTELSDVEQVGTQGYHATTAGHTIELTYNNANATIQIDNNGNFEDMRQIFHDAANALNPSLGDEAYSLFDEGVNMMSTEEDGFISTDAFNADFSAPNEFEGGHIQLIVQK